MMQRIKMFQVDAFADRLFSGNPAAICLLDSWLADDLMQSIAGENNLAETAFIVQNGQDFEIRWFTPTVEVDLCGHATLASAFVLFNVVGVEALRLHFHSPRSGLLAVEKRGDMLYLDFPTDQLVALAPTTFGMLEQCIGTRPLEAYRGKTDFLVVLGHEGQVRDLQPNLVEVSKLSARGLIVTAKGEEVDFVSRFFAPQSGIDEDPVTGSAHTSLSPLWSSKLGKQIMTAAQLSLRGGQLVCEHRGDRCLIGGKAQLFLTGEIFVG